ncbi:MAG: DUF4340 domain-containing protein [Kiritimatiellae bacterium]|nr:DUF4340 domain-containing protein [Kiritimatiellia bacterium]
MTNLRTIVFFIFGICVLAFALVAPALLHRGEAPIAMREVLLQSDPDEIREIAFGEMRVRKSHEGEWRLLAPIACEADNAAIQRLVDALAQTRIMDCKSAAELRSLGKRAEDFGLAHNPLAVTLISQKETETILFGAVTPTRTGTYARISGDGAIYTLPASVRDAIPSEIGACRRRAAMRILPGAAATIEIRSENSAFVKIVRAGRDWRFTSPADAPADREAVDALLARLFTVEAIDFADDAAEAGAWFAGEDAFEIAVSDGIGKTDKIAFGASAGEGLVRMRFSADDATATALAAAADECKALVAAFRDVRIFDAEAAAITKFAAALPAGIFAMARDAAGAWRIESPVSAPADGAAAEAFAQRIASLRRSDISDAADGVKLTVSTASTNFPPVAVRRSAIAPEEFPALRSRSVLALKPQSIRRIIVVDAAGGETRIERDATRDSWSLVRRPGEATGSRHLAADAVKRLLATLGGIDATEVAALARDKKDDAEYGLAKPFLAVSIDTIIDARARRITFFLGAKTAGGRYLAEGGAGAVFTIPDETAAALAAPLTEQ